MPSPDRWQLKADASPARGAGPGPDGRRRPEGAARTAGILRRAGEILGARILGDMSPASTVLLGRPAAGRAPIHGDRA